MRRLRLQKECPLVGSVWQRCELQSGEILKPQRAPVLPSRDRTSTPLPREMSRRPSASEITPALGGNDGSSKSKKIRKEEPKVHLDALGEKAKDQAWVARVKKDFIKKFYAPSAPATKNTKRKKITEIFSRLDSEIFPMTTESFTTLAAVLDAPGMKAGDQYLAEAKLMQIEAGMEWSQQMDKQLAMCKRAIQRDKGPEVRAKEVKIGDIPDNEWNKMNGNPNEPRRVAWSYAWATIWMLRAIEASQLVVEDMQIIQEERVVRLHIKKSKTDQKGSGTWRTLRCCGEGACVKDCPFDLAAKAKEDVKGAASRSPLFPDCNGQLVSKVHMVTSWASRIDAEMTGHSARRSGAMAYARRGLPISSIQFWDVECRL